MDDRQIVLSAKGLSAEELLEQSDIQFAAMTNLGKLVDQVGQWCREATTFEEKANLWAQYEGLCRDYRVLMAWYSITYSAYVFSESGSELKTVTIEGLQLTGAILTDH
ncbi:hypothetical protein [Amycolatopsis suaedae]|uniref:Uncharacterized protein n=1 Tax=Amycolatopsis suaedae TaxID=2510978 RepID=A0A4V2ELP2_9PSEU|nr:hypothetical protein [Amycolatopsis suaedae]RZQ62255.1 hypothetical protein EWH70_18405 [Amycolatopsis suaedae]